MPELALEVYRDLKQAGLAVVYDQQAAIGKRYRRQDEIGTPFCITVDGTTLEDRTVTFRHRDTLEQWRVPMAKVLEELQTRLKG
jgi:glycyl-tRNA synthetase